MFFLIRRSPVGIGTLSHYFCRVFSLSIQTVVVVFAGCSTHHHPNQWPSPGWARRWIDRVVRMIQRCLWRRELCWGRSSQMMSSMRISGRWKHGTTDRGDGREPLPQKSRPAMPALCNGAIKYHDPLIMRNQDGSSLPNPEQFGSPLVGVFSPTS